MATDTGKDRHDGLPEWSDASRRRADGGRRLLLVGSTSYDPLGTVLSSSGQSGRLGYQSSWTDPATKKVDMGAR